MMKKYLLPLLFSVLLTDFAQADRKETTEIKIADLISYLQAPSIPEEVKNLVLKARQNYEDSLACLWTKSVPWDAAGGGRSGNWIKKTFSQSEQKIVEALKKISGPQTWTIGTINKVYKKISTLRKESKEPIIVVEGVGVNGLHRAPLGQEAFVQLASQFNYLESPGPYKVPVSDYLYDLTQGPLGAIEASAAALHRLAAQDSGQLPHALYALLPKEAEPFYKHGYLMLADMPEAICEKVYTHIAKRIDQLNILPQWVWCEASDTTQLQVFSAAPSFQGNASPSPGSWAEKLSTLLVAKQYEALGKLAAIRSLLTGKPTLVHLTLVGQGVFNNPPSVLQNSLKQFYVAIQGFNVHAYVHAFTPDSRESVSNLLSEERIPFREMTCAQFKSTAL